MKDGLGQVSNRTINFSRRKESWEQEFSLDVGLGKKDRWEKDERVADRLGVCWWVQDGPADCWRLWHSCLHPKTIWGLRGCRRTALLLDQFLWKWTAWEAWAVSGGDKFGGLRWPIKASWRRMLEWRRWKKGTLELEVSFTSPGTTL